MSLLKARGILRLRTFAHCVLQKRRRRALTARLSFHRAVLHLACVSVLRLHRYKRVKVIG